MADSGAKCSGSGAKCCDSGSCESAPVEKEAASPVQVIDELINTIGLGRWSLPMIASYVCWGLVLPYFSLGGAFLNPNVEYWCAAPSTPFDNSSNSSSLGHHDAGSHLQQLQQQQQEGRDLYNHTYVWTVREGARVRSRCREYDFESWLQQQQQQQQQSAAAAGSPTQQPADGWYGEEEVEEIEVDEEELLWNMTGTPPTRRCHKWEYDTSTFKSTVAMEWDLVCSRAGLSPFFQSFYYFGTMVGEPLLGYLSDKWGRRWVLRRVWPLFVVFAVTSISSSSFTLLIAMRFLLGMLHASGSVGYVMVSEICPTRYRTLFTLSLTATYALTGMVFAGVSYLIREWRTLQAVCILPALLHLAYLPFLDESPRWLLQRGEVDRAVQSLQRAASLHRVQLPYTEQQLRQLLQLKPQQAPSSPSSPHPRLPHRPILTRVKHWLRELLLLVRTPVLRAISLAMFSCWFVSGLTYWGLSLSGGSFSSDPYLYMLFSSLMEIPGYTWFIPLLSFYGRRVVLSANFVGAALSMFAILATPDEHIWLIFCLAMAGKLFIVAAYNLLYLYSVELFPTCVRSRGLNVSSMMARVAAVMAPFVVKLMANSWAVSAVFGSAAAVGSLLTLLLPESQGRPLLDSVEQLEHIYGKKGDSVGAHRSPGEAGEAGAASRSAGEDGEAGAVHMGDVTKGGSSDDGDEVVKGEHQV